MSFAHSVHFWTPCSGRKKNTFFKQPHHAFLFSFERNEKFSLLLMQCCMIDFWKITFWNSARKGKCLKLLQFRKRSLQSTLKLIHFKFLPGIMPNSTLFATVFEKISSHCLFKKCSKNFPLKSETMLSEKLKRMVQIFETREPRESLRHVTTWDEAPCQRSLSTLNYHRKRRKMFLRIRDLLQIS